MSGTIEMFCPQWYYHSTISNEYQEQIKRLFDSQVYDDSIYTASPWDCDCLTTFQSESNMKLPWNDWLECIRLDIDDAIDKLKPKIDIEVIPQDAWANKYNRGHFQEYHTHEVPFCNLSMVYFYDIPDNEDVGFRFWYDSHSKYKKSGLAQAFDMPVFPRVIPKVKQGDFMIFPSHYAHMVAPNRNDKPRITFSGNLYVVPNDKESQRDPTPLKK